MRMHMATSEVRGENRWPMAITLVVAVGLTITLPIRFSWGPAWLFPALEIAFLISVIAVDPGRIDRRSREVRIFNIGLVAILVVKAAAITVRLVIDLIQGGSETNSASLLLRDGFTVWLFTIISFAFRLLGL